MGNCLSNKQYLKQVNRLPNKDTERILESNLKHPNQSHPLIHNLRNRPHQMDQQEHQKEQTPLKQPQPETPKNEPLDQGKVYVLAHILI